METRCSELSNLKIILLKGRFGCEDRDIPRCTFFRINLKGYINHMNGKTPSQTTASFWKLHKEQKPAMVQVSTMDSLDLRICYKAVVSLSIVYSHFLSVPPNSLCSKLYLPPTLPSSHPMDSFYGDYREWGVKR